MHVQLADPNAGNAPVGDWIKISPFQNVYDVQRTDSSSHCQFDPVDDGNDEDSLFDPEDPTALIGPSSTCFPEFSFAALGDSHPTRLFSEELTGRASDPEFSDPGTQGGGTWVQSKFDLGRFRGRTVRLRYLATTAEFWDAEDWIQAGFPVASQLDDGWYIDDVLIAEALATPAILSVDGAANGDTPSCAGVGGCVSVTPVITISPTGDIGPGQVVEINASGSSADQCTDGTLHYRFFRDINMSGDFDSADILLRDFTDNPIVVDAPMVSTDYGVEVICTSDPSCPTSMESTSVNAVGVACPQNAILSGHSPFTGTLEASKPSNDPTGLRLDWPVSVVDMVRGTLSTLRSSGSYATAIDECTHEDTAQGARHSLTFSGIPAVGDAFFFVLRPEATFCNEDAGSYSTQSTREQGSTPGAGPSERDTEISADASSCLE
jgi:hypothetical protein